MLATAIDTRASGERERPRLRLRTRIARYLAVTVAASLCISVLAVIVLRHRSQVRSMEESARTYAALVVMPLVDAASLYRTTGGYVLRQHVDRWRSLNNDLQTLEVVTVTGNVVMRSDAERLVTYPAAGAEAPVVTDTGLLEAIRGLGVTAERVREMRQGRVFQVVAPAVEEWGRHTYSLVATFGYRNVNRELGKSIALAVLLLGIALVLANRVAVALAGTITRSLDRLHEGVQRIRRGELSEDLEVQSNDEIQELAEAFNATAQELGSTIERLREANRELETLDQTKADLVANISHELKTPLTALRGYLELLAEHDLGALPPGADHAVTVCRKNLDRLSLRIEELMQLSRLERSYNPELTMETVHVGRILHDVAETLIPRCEEKGQFCTLNLAADMPTIWGSLEYLERVFLNLLDNAAKFTPEGGHIRVSAEPVVREGCAGMLVSIADSGVGVPSLEQLRIFDRFYQVDPSARRRYGGMGLGLSVARNIVEAHRGTIWVESDEARGSTFFVWLPCQGAEGSGGHHPVTPGESSPKPGPPADGNPE